MAGTKPTILLVHGAWHGPHHLQSFVELLESSGFKVVTPDLPSVGADPPTPDQTEDIKTIRNAILSIIDDGSDCLVGLHSYAGVPGSSALEGLGKTQRNEIGKKGGVTGLVYFPAWVMLKGKSLVPKGGPYSPDWDIQGDIFYPKDPKHMFFNDLSDEEGERHASTLRAQSLGILFHPATYEPWHDIKTYYLICENDVVCPVEIQEKMVAGFEGKVEVSRSPAGHSPYLSQKEILVDLFKKAASQPAL